MPFSQPKGSDDKRWALKAATASRHERVERLYDRLNFARRDHRQHFLLANFIAYRHILPSLADSEIHGAVEHNISLLAGDLDRLDIAGLPGEIACPVPATAGLGVRYVLAGSSFGKKVLARRWEVATGRRAPSFLRDTTLQAEWSVVAADLKRVTRNPGTLEEVISEARLCFSVFEGAFLAASAFMESNGVVKTYEEPLRLAI